MATWRRRESQCGSAAGIRNTLHELSVRLLFVPKGKGVFHPCSTSHLTKCNGYRHSTQWLCLRTPLRRAVYRMAAVLCHSCPVPRHILLTKKMVPCTWALPDAFHRRLPAMRRQSTIGTRTCGSMVLQRPFFAGPNGQLRGCSSPLCLQAMKLTARHALANEAITAATLTKRRQGQTGGCLLSST